MKKVLTFGLIICCLTACKKETKETNSVQETEKKEMAYQPFGDEITAENALTSSELSERYSSLKDGDTISIKFAGKIGEVCQKKGCWMTVALNDDQTTMVRFKDYGFFVPMNAGERNAVMEGKAFVRETSVEELKHYAKDAGKSEEEIAKITAPKREFAFEASGVLIEE